MFGYIVACNLCSPCGQNLKENRVEIGNDNNKQIQKTREKKVINE